MTGLNIRTYASPKWDRTRCPDEQRPMLAYHTRSKCSMENSRNLVKKDKLGNKVQFSNGITT